MDTTREQVQRKLQDNHIHDTHHQEIPTGTLNLRARFLLDTIPREITRLLPM